MARTIRIASYNVENLFQRSKILALTNSERIRELLDQYAELSGLISKTTYSNADKSRIVQLYRLLKNYVSVNTYQGRLFNRNRSQVVVNGRNDWFGTLDLKKQSYKENARKNTAWVIKQIKADILCVVEAENRPALQKFSSNLLRSTSTFKKYPFNILIDGNDNRGIDVGLYSRFPIRDVRTNIFDDDGTKSVFSRDCLEVEVDIGADKTMWLLVNHLKSKGYGRPASSTARRKSQAQAIAKILNSRHDLNNRYVVVAGDLNDTPGSAPLRPLLGVSNLHDSLDLKFAANMEARWTYSYRGSKDQIDYVLLSEPLKSKFRDAGVERRGIYKVNQVTNNAIRRYSGITRPTEQASDHGAVWVDLEF